MTSFEDVRNIRTRFRNIGQPVVDTNNLICFLLFILCYTSSTYSKAYIPLISSFIGIYYTGFYMYVSYIRSYQVPESDSDHDEAEEGVTHDTSDGEILEDDDRTEQEKRDSKALNQLREFANNIQESNLRRNENASDDDLPPLIPMDESYWYNYNNEISSVNNDISTTTDYLNHYNNTVHLRHRGHYAPSAEGADI